MLPKEKHRKARVLTPPGLHSMEKIIRIENRLCMIVYSIVCIYHILEKDYFGPYILLILHTLWLAWAIKNVFDYCALTRRHLHWQSCISICDLLHGVELQRLNRVIDTVANLKRAGPTRWPAQLSCRSVICTVMDGPYRRP